MLCNANRTTVSGIIWLIASMLAGGLAFGATTVKHLKIDIAVNADGSFTEILHSEVSATEDVEAQRLAQISLPFNPLLERLEVVEAYTLKPRDVRKNVRPDAIRTLRPTSVRNAPMFSDVQEKVIVFPDLQANDTRALTFRREVIQPLFPGQFTWWDSFPRTEAWDDVTITISAPSTYKLYTAAYELSPETREEGDRTIRIWHYHAESGTEHYATDPNDYRPRVFVSSFPDYNALAAAYQALAAPKEAVTPEIQVKAEEITAGIADQKEKARALYDWVSQHIRYVAIYLNRGAIEPHAADIVLANGYGDCKDHVVLLASLLKAIGIESRAVIINFGNAYTLSGPPTLAELNHVLTYIPEFDLYADSTLGVASFGTLAFGELSKPAVMIGGNGQVLQRLPSSSNPPADIRVSTAASIDADGTIAGTTITTLAGPTAVALRLVMRSLQAAGKNMRDVADSQLRSMGESGTGDAASVEVGLLAPVFAVASEFRLDPNPAFSSGGAVSPPVGLQWVVRPGDYLLGPLNALSLPASEPTPCFSGHQLEDLSVAMDHKPTRLPADRKIDQPEFTYVSHWSVQGNVLHVRRELTSRINQPLCEGDLRKRAMDALRLIHQDRQAAAWLPPPME